MFCVIEIHDPFMDFIRNHPKEVLGSEFSFPKSSLDPSGSFITSKSLSNQEKVFFKIVILILWTKPGFFMALQPLHV